MIGMNAGGGDAVLLGGRMTLADLVRHEATSSMSEAEKLKAARATRLYFQRPERPGFLVSETEAGPVVALFTSVRGLALFAGACSWASTTVADVIELLPDEVTALVDPLGERPFLLDVEALREPKTDDGEQQQGNGGERAIDQS
ncbi:SseB family protein [Streptomyces globisporus]|uniref:SseB family protein n=1 Tax=Streptomyces globisporus TaxID=1908 RepID=UPI001F2F2573|nr:SseB family protein [Streptomyces globisporus]